MRTAATGGDRLGLPWRLAALPLAVLITWTALGWPAPAHGQPGQSEAMTVVLAEAAVYRERIQDLAALVAVPPRDMLILCVIDEEFCEQPIRLDDISPSDRRAVASGALDDLARRVRASPIPKTAPSLYALQRTFSQFDRFFTDHERYLVGLGREIGEADRTARIVVVARDFALRPGRSGMVRDVLPEGNCYGGSGDLIRTARPPEAAVINLHLVVPGGTDREAEGFSQEAANVVANTLGSASARPPGPRRPYPIRQSASACPDIAAPVATMPVGSGECRFPSAKSTQPKLSCAGSRILTASQPPAPVPPGAPPATGPAPILPPSTARPTPPPGPGPVATLTPVVPGTAPLGGAAPLGGGAAPQAPGGPPDQGKAGGDSRGLPSGPSPGAGTAPVPGLRPERADALLVPGLRATTAIRLAPGTGALPHLTLALQAGSGLDAGLVAVGPGQPAPSAARGPAGRAAMARVDLPASAAAGIWRIFLEVRARDAGCSGGLDLVGRVAIALPHEARAAEFRAVADACPDGQAVAYLELADFRVK